MLFRSQSLSERASERRARKVSYILLGVALLSGVLFLLAGAGWNKAAAAMAAVLCMGAPLSSTLIAGVASLRLQRAAAAVGAVVPGWQAIEQLGGIDTLQIDADDLFTADSAQLEDIRIFKGGRIDRAILYAASVLNQSGGTLQGLFRQIIEDRTDILFPVKDLEIHRGLGFAAWCDNNHIQIGTRRFLEQEGVALPDEVDFIGYDNVDLCSIVSPKLEIVEQPMDEMGLRAAELLLARLTGDASPAKLLRLKAKLSNL